MRKKYDCDPAHVSGAVVSSKCPSRENFNEFLWLALFSLNLCSPGKTLCTIGVDHELRDKRKGMFLVFPRYAPRKKAEGSARNPLRCKKAEEAARQNRFDQSRARPRSRR